MRHYAKSLLIAFLLASGATWAQELDHASDPNLMARFSYERPPTGGPRFQQICMSVFQDGHYRMLSYYYAPSSTGEIGPMRRQGKMTKDQLQQLKTLLTEPGFRSLSGNHGGLIRNYAENFMAEISRIEISPDVQLIPTAPSGQAQSDPGRPLRLQWLNPDDESPFPESMAKIIDWMERFQSQDLHFGGDLEISDVCPSVGLSLVRPSIAANDRPKDDSHRDDRP
jgi:hypothetical protein